MEKQIVMTILSSIQTARFAGVDRSRKLHRLVTLSGMFLSMTPSILCQATPPTVTCTNQPTINTTSCTVAAPIVTRPMTEYDGQFHKEIFLASSNDSGDRVFGVDL